MPLLTQAEYVFGDLRVRYQAPADRADAWGLSFFPAALTDRVVRPREELDTPAFRGLGAPWNTVRACDCDPLVHVHVAV